MTVISRGVPSNFVQMVAISMTFSMYNVLATPVAECCLVEDSVFTLPNQTCLADEDCKDQTQPAVYEDGLAIASSLLENPAESSESPTPVADMVVLLSFVLLRVAVALRSIDLGSPYALWIGVGFASLTRTVAEGATMDGADSFILPGSLSAFLSICLREFLHTYGLCYALERLPGSC